MWWIGKVTGVVNHPFYLSHQSAHKEALEKKTKEKRRQSYLVETSSEILTQAEEGAEATNHIGVQHKVSRSIDRGLSA